MLVISALCPKDGKLVALELPFSFIRRSAFLSKSVTNSDLHFLLRLAIWIIIELIYKSPLRHKLLQKYILRHTPFNDYISRNLWL